MVMEDRRLSSRQIATRMGISQERAVNILTNELGMSKVSARWVPRLFTPDQKRTRRTMSAENLELFEADPEDFMARFVTVDEFWVHHYQLETKEQSKQWKHASSPTPKKAKVTVSAGKDNAPAHTSVVVMAKSHDCGFQLILHPPYSPDLAPSDSHLFPNLKKYLAGRRFTTDDEVMDAVDTYLQDQDSEFYNRGIKALQHR
ncbi:histone-lysine N-methyltransferase SETMAR-like [Oratosquilla oratoria]|uniref:histone-lysine N-methyltransferase SETMAR-like n=1 Tax=Oratosquilla oratoria TaxID=337810 RepID=UPI003F76BF03